MNAPTTAAARPSPSGIGRPRHGEWWVAGVVSLARALMADGSVAQARAVLESARDINATDRTRYALGEELLRASNGADGWDLYDLHPSRPDDRLAGVPRWNGDRCETLVLLAEQGFGDTIQFLRYVPQAAALAGTVVLAVHDELLTTVANSPVLADCDVVPKSLAHRRRWPAGTRWERLLSLPRHGMAVDAAPAHLVAPAIPSHLVLPDDDRLTVGLAWRSTPRAGVPERSIPPAAIERHILGAGARTVSLHRPGDVNEVPGAVRQLETRDFRDTAAVISQCDVVVTADTVTAHLAPALGVPTIVGLRHWPDWRWGTRAAPTRWYDTQTLVFQETPGAWDDVMARAAGMIANLSARIGRPC